MRSTPLSSDRLRHQWLAIGGVPGGELLVCLILMSREELGGGAEVVGAGGGQSHRGLHPGPGQLGSSEEAGRANGAGCGAEDGEGLHCRRRTTVNRTGTMVRGEVWMETGRGGEKCSRILPVVWCRRLRHHTGIAESSPDWPR